MGTPEMEGKYQELLPNVAGKSTVQPSYCKFAKTKLIALGCSPVKKESKVPN